MTDPAANQDADSSDQDELVAYLDGEVGDEQRELIEQRLADDENYRQLLVELQSAWQLLDRLPAAHADASFTKTTIAMVATQVDGVDQESADTVSTAGKARRRRLSNMIALAAVAVAGFLLIAVPSYLQRRAEIRDLPVIENAELYRYAENIEFLRMLDEANLFDDEDEYAL